MIEYGIFLQLNRLVTERWVDGWDDPRLMTLAGLRRRGVTSTAINAFVRGIGITRRFNMCYGYTLEHGKYVRYLMPCYLKYAFSCVTVIIVQ